MAFTGVHANLKFKDCKEPRFAADGRPRRLFCYLPIIPRLQGFFQNPKKVEQLLYRHKHIPGTICDVFDSDNYRNLRKTKVVVDDQGLSHCYFSSKYDIALSICTDSYLLFERRRKGPSATPILAERVNSHFWRPILGTCFPSSVSSRRIAPACSRAATTAARYTTAPPLSDTRAAPPLLFVGQEHDLHTRVRIEARRACEIHLTSINCVLLLQMLDIDIFVVARPAPFLNLRNRAHEAPPSPCPVLAFKLVVRGGRMTSRVVTNGYTYYVNDAEEDALQVNRTRRMRPKIFRLFIVACACFVLPSSLEVGMVPSIVQ
ncbi:hypothetical protein B0H19DRAFT_1266953 [Mycena capillaripes]|nr:hypothetical protein B0H19DRAFT_1266953 [Mycena capillaripes]